MENPAIEPYNFVEHLKSWQTKWNLRQKQAADILGVNLNTMKGWLSGQHEPVQFVIDELRKRMNSYSPPGTLISLNPTILQ